MKWFKHLSTARNDERIAQLEDKAGLEGYGFYFKMLELVAEVIDSTDRCEVTYSLTRWGRQANISSKKFLFLVQCCADAGLMFVQRSDDNITITLADKLLGGLDSNRPPSHAWKSIRSRIFHRDNYTCQYCGERGKRLECDHVVPVSRGGSHSDGNLVTACFKCNRSKRSKLISEWRRKNG